MRPIIFLFITLSAVIKLQAQGWTEADELGNRNVGLRLGTGVYSIFGGELHNPTPKIGFQAGFFWYGTKPEKRLNWQTGMEACFLGSNFNNKDSFGNMSNSNYSQIAIIQLDIPLLLNMRVKPYTEKSYDCVQLGLIPGIILSSAVYVGSNKAPVQQSNLKTWENLPLQPVNFIGVLGYQHTGSQVGYNLRLKASVLNMNDNFNLPALLPATGTGKWIGTWGVEAALLF
jgi:hypothetical protein